METSTKQETVQNKSFNALNPIGRMVSISDRTPEAILKRVSEIETPVSIKFMFPYGNRVYAILEGDIRVKTKTRSK